MRTGLRWPAEPPDPPAASRCAGGRTVMHIARQSRWCRPGWLDDRPSSTHPWMRSTNLVLRWSLCSSRHPDDTATETATITADQRDRYRSPPATPGGPGLSGRRELPVAARGERTQRVGSGGGLSTLETALRIVAP